MTSRERVMAAMEGKQADMPPLMLWIEPHALLNIARELRPPRNPVDRLAMRLIDSLSEGLPTPDLRNGATLLVNAFQERYLRELGADISEFQWGAPLLWLRGVELKEGKLVLTDGYGVRRGIGAANLDLLDPLCPTADELRAYRFPDVSAPIHYHHIRLYRALHPDVCVSVRCPGVLDWGMVWQGMERIFTSMIEYPDVVKEFFGRIADHGIEIIRNSIRAGADMVMIADDFGDQRSLMISKPMWEEFVLPQLRRMIDAAHDAGGKVLLHSCGTVASILDRLVEAGLDALHPFQCLPGNNLEEAKREYGDRLCFFVGIDVQRMPDSTPEAIREEIIRLWRVGGRGGGMAFATANYLMPDTPIANIRAMFDTINDIRKGKVSLDG